MVLEITHTLKLHAFDAASPLLHHAVDIYAQVWERSVEDSLLFLRKHTRQKYFKGFVACVDETPVGMVFGTISQTGQWWHDKVAMHVGRHHPALQQAWMLTELAVLPAYRNRAIGGKLHDAVVQAQPLPNMLLSTQQSNTGAQRFYERRGWQMLHTGFAFSRYSEKYVIMCRERESSPA